MTKVNSQQNSVNDLKDPKSNIKCHNVPKNATKKREIATLPTF